jgi:PAS domain S-box-containing protein
MSGWRGRGREAIVDTAVVSLAIGAVLWEVCVAPTITSSGSLWNQVVTPAYPAMDVVLVVAVIYTVFTIGRWVPAAWMFVVGISLQLVADSIYARLSAEGLPNSTHWLDPFWPASYVLVAAAALHPTMKLLGRRVANDQPTVARLRVALLGVAVFAAPAVAVLAVVQGRDEDAIGLGILTAVVAALLVWRFDNLVRATNRAYEQVHDSEERFRALVQHASDVLTVVDEQARIQYVSPAIVDLLGDLPERYLGTQVIEHVHPDDFHSAETAFARALGEPGRTYSFEVRVEHADGSWRWIESTCTNQLDEPAVRGVVGNMRDISQRKRTEALESGEAKVLGLLARGAPLAESLDMLIRTVEELLGARCSIRLVDPTTGRLNRAFAPNVPDGYLEVLDHVALTPVTLSESGVLRNYLQASERDEEIAADGLVMDGVVEHDDVASNSLWPEVSAAATVHGLHRSWTLQVRAANGGQVLATFSVYWPDSATPGAAEQALLERWSHLAAIAIDHARSQEPRRVVPRSRPVQADQRQPRARDRRSGADRSRRTALGRAPRCRHRCAARR